MKPKTNTILLCSFLVLALTPSALAYGDPAAGGFVIQALLAGAFAGVAMFKGQIARIFSFLRPKPRSVRLTHAK